MPLRMEPVTMNAAQVRAAASSGEALPKGLHVGDDLNLSGTPISVLPNGLTVDGNLDLRGTPISVPPTTSPSAAGWT